MGLPVAVAVGLIASGAGTVFAGEEGERAGGATLSPEQLAQKLHAQGYPTVLRMEMEDGVYEVKVKTSDGKRLKLNVDPSNGKILGRHKDGLFSN